jgi:hypothetical protein
MGIIEKAKQEIDAAMKRITVGANNPQLTASF